MEIVDRLIKFRDFTGMSNSQFADQADIPRPTLSQFLNGRNKRLSDELVAKLHIAYPELNVMWLLFGEGEMVDDANIKTSTTSQDLFSTVKIEQPVEKQSNELTAEEENVSMQNGPIYKKEDNAYSEERKNPTFEQNINLPPVVPTDPHKTIRSIMVFYSDNSYETFIPAGSRTEPGQ